MELTREAYRALEDIVGSDYITEEPAIRDTYNQVWGNKLVYGEKWSLRPAAVLLPASTEEVQAIVRACNKYKIMFKPFSSGFEIVATALAAENGIILDLRRMDRILEIDEKNMHAVVEPYVSTYRLQIEAAKQGLYVANVGAGPMAGVIAASCCHFGSGHTACFTGGLDRNVLGVEWVLPTGDVLKLGTGGMGIGSFSADGPGLSLRGILRGHSGANGGHGVITKASVKLYPWYGPKEWEQVRDPGQPPVHRHPTSMPDNYKSFVYSFPDEDSRFDAMREIGMAEIAFIIHPGGAELARRLEGNDMLWEGVQFLQEIAKQAPAPNPPRENLTVMLCASTPREMAYREKCLEKVASKYNGVMEPVSRDTMTMAALFYSYCYSFDMPLGAFRFTGDFFISPCADATQDMMKNQRKVALEMIMPYFKNGAVFDMGKPWLFHPVAENYSVGTHLENCYQYDPFDDFSREETRKLVGETIDPKGKAGRFGVPALGGGLQIEPHTHIHQEWGPYYDNYDMWQRKIKVMLDPNGVGDWSAYIPAVFP